VAALAAALAGAVILGEYELVGARALLAGGLFGVTVAEVMATVHRGDADPDPHLLAASALVAEAGLVWALWISTGRDLDLAGAGGWAGVVVGVVAAPAWLRTARRRGPRTTAA
jgi:hypothetical protein